MLKTSLGLKHIEDLDALREELGYITKAGFDTVDLDLSMQGQREMLHDPDCLKRAAAARKVLDEFGIKPYQGHSPYNMHRLDDPDFDRLRHEEVLLSLPAAAELGIEYMIVHPFFCHNSSDPLFLDRDALLDINVKMYTEFTERAKELGVKLCTENMFADCANHTERMRTYYSSAADLNRLMDAVPGLTCCMDTGHAMVCHYDIAEMARELGSRITTLHLHHNSGAADMHMPPFQQFPTDWAGFCAALRDIGYTGSMNLEVGWFTAVCPRVMMMPSYQYLYATARTLTEMMENA